jgi:DNA-binding GntR family transcriptional regulator
MKRESFTILQSAESMERSDAELLEAVRGGDRSAIEEILERHFQSASSRAASCW